MSVDLTSIVQCRNLYIDYYYKGNKAGTAKSDIKLIEQQYADYLNKWAAIGKGRENDTNIYDIDDDEWNLYESEGNKSASDKTGYTKGSSGRGWSMTGNGLFAAGATGFSLAGGSLVTGLTSQLGAQAGKAAGEQVLKEAAREAGKQAAKEVMENAAKEGVKKGVGKAAREAGKKASEDVMKGGVKELTGDAAKNASEASTNASSKVKDATWIISIPLELASAIIALASDANGEEADALANLTTQMTTAQSDLASAQDQMEAAATAVANKEQEVIDINDESSTQMIEYQTKTDLLYARYMTLKQKKESGQELTDGEEYLLAACKSGIESNNTAQDALQAAAETAKTDAVAELETKNAIYDAAGETVANTQGMTEYGASFDKATRVLCFVTMAFDALNTAMAIKDGVRAGMTAAPLLWAGAWIWAFVAMAATAATMSVIDGVHQYQHIKTVNEEIGVRETTEEATQNAYGTYDGDIVEYDGSMQSLGELEVLDLEKKTVSS